MSEENTQATTETVSESPATETTQRSSNEQYIAESIAKGLRMLKLV